MVQSATTDVLGSIVFRKVPPGKGYSVIAPEVAGPNVESPVDVTSMETPVPAVAARWSARRAQLVGTAAEACGRLSFRVRWLAASSMLTSFSEFWPGSGHISECCRK